MKIKKSQFTKAIRTIAVIIVFGSIGFFTAKKDLEKAENYWNKFEPAALIPKAQILATEAAITILKNENKTAQNKIEAAENEIENMLDKGLGIALKEKLSQMKST